MNEKIPFKKDIIFKSSIGEITDITLTHDYKIKDEIIEGVFYLSGRYKMTEASVIEEDFFYNIPFSIAISQRINKDSINLTIDSFDYKIKKDVLSASMNLNMEYEEDRVENSIEEVLQNHEETENNTDIDIDNTNVETKNEDMTIFDDLNIKTESNELTNENTNNILGIAKNTVEGNNYSTYKVINMRENVSIDNILSKYNITMNDIELLNDIDDINTSNKIIIPVIKNE